MKKSFSLLSRVLAVSVAVLMTTPVWADKPSWAGNGKEGKSDKSAEKSAKQGGKHDEHHDSEIKLNAYFGSQQRDVAHAYYGEQFRAGKCPPGLAKKNNGCLPPGQAKKWAVGQPLGGLQYYGVPLDLARRLGVPPSGHEYVRVGADILLITIGTGMVIDAIEDLGRM